MECERIQDLLSEYLDGSILENRRADVSAHLRECRTCAQVAEGLESTVRLLRNLPPMEAPPELLARIRRETAREAPGKPLWKKLFLPAHVKIPIEAAAAILLFLLVYGVQKKEPPAFSPPPPAAKMEASAPAAKETAEPAKKAAPAEPAPSRTAKASPPSPPASERASAERLAKRQDLEQGARAGGAAGRFGMRGGAPLSGSMAAAKSPSAAPAAQPALPSVPVERVSTAAERIEPAASPEAPAGAGKEAPLRMMAAPPSRVLHPMPYGREVTLEVASSEVQGLEERIVGAAMRWGGNQVREPAARPAAMEEKTTPPEAVRVQLPAESAEPFLFDLRKLGTIPPEGAPAWADLPAGPSTGTVLYTVRIRVR